jgi:predicted permease
MRSLVVRVRGVWRSRAERDLDDDLAFHVEMQAGANHQAGLSEPEARLRAKRQFGGVEQSKERCRDLRAFRWFDDLVRDVHYALRTFRRSPGFVAVAVLVLGLGIGANTAIYSLLNGLLFRPLPVPSAGDLRYLHTLSTRRADEIPQAVPYGTFRYLAAHNDAFTGVAQVEFDEAKIGSALQPLRVVGEKVSTNYFDVLQIHAAQGRTFIASDDANPVLIVSDRFWRQNLGANPHAVGTTIGLGAQSYIIPFYSPHHCVYTIIGVMPPGFHGVADWLGSADFWAPIRQRAADSLEQKREDEGDIGRTRVEDRMRAAIVARLKPGVTDRRAQPTVLAANQHLHEEDSGNPSLRREKRILLYDTQTAAQSVRGRGGIVPERLAIALMLVSTLVLLIAAINLAGILMARGVSRRAEIAARLALGAGRGRVARQLLTESLLLSLAGSVVAVGMARLFIGLFTASMPAQLERTFYLFVGAGDVPIDLRALLFTAALGVGAGVVVGLTPALQALKTNVLPALSGGSGLPATARSRVRRWILIPQIGLSLVLLLVAGVLVHTLVLAEHADRGIEPEKVFHATFWLKQLPGDWTPERRRADDERNRAVRTRLLEKIRQAPAVRQAALTDGYWMGPSQTSVVTRSGFGVGENRYVSSATVSSGYFEAMGVPIVRGRAFDARDTTGTTPVAIVCERLAEWLWPGKDPLGQYLAEYNPKDPRGGPTWLQVVGVAKEVKRPGQEERVVRSVYTPLEQSSHWATNIVVRGRATAEEVRQTVMSAIGAAEVEVEIAYAATLVEDIDRGLYPRRLATAILALSGLLGLLLSAVGLYGIVSYSAAQRVREIGIRTALGAERRDIVVLMLRDAMVALGVGVVCGVVLGYAGMRIVSSLVVGLPALDMVTLVTVPALLCAVILAACLLPARRAARVNPVEVLRGL